MAFTEVEAGIPPTLPHTSPSVWASSWGPAKKFPYGVKEPEWATLVVGSSYKTGWRARARGRDSPSYQMMAKIKNAPARSEAKKKEESPETKL